MKSKISAMMDGELGDDELSEPFRALREDEETLETWRRYHLISDSMRDTQVLSPGFSTRFSERLALEPTVLSPSSLPVRVEKHRHLLPLSIAASGAAVALVGWLAFLGFAPQGDQIALTRGSEIAATISNTIVPLSGEVNDYLLAHQHHSPRSALQGVAHYVRTVSDSARPR